MSRTKPTEIHLLILERDCDYCGATSGVWCKSANGRWCSFLHSARFYAWRRVKDRAG